MKPWLNAGGAISMEMRAFLQQLRTPCSLWARLCISHHWRHVGLGA
jgi:hypothetical protein